MRKEYRSLFVAVYCVLITVPPVDAVFAVFFYSQQPVVCETSSCEKVLINGAERDIELRSVITTWRMNNTRKYFVTGLLRDYGIQVNITKFTRISDKKGSIVAEGDLPPPGTIPVERWDGKYCLLKGSYGSCMVAYNHDDNYYTYRPEEWYTHWDMQGDERTHVHLSVQDVKAMKDEAQGLEHAYGQIFGYGGGIVTIVTAAAALVCPVPLVIPILAAAATVLGRLLEDREYSRAEWVENVVKAWKGDGWYWYWNIVHHESWWCERGLFWHSRDVTELWEAWGAERDETELVSIGWTESTPGVYCPSGGGTVSLKRANLD